jgi:hypothetical protein
VTGVVQTLLATSQRFPSAQSADAPQSCRQAPVEGSQRYAPHSVTTPSTEVDLAPSVEHVPFVRAGTQAPPVHS